MENLVLALEIVAPLFFMMAIGYGIKLSGMMNETSVKQMNKVVFKIFLPLLLFMNIYNTEIAESFNGKLLAFALVCVLLQFGISLGIVLVCQKDNRKRGVMLQAMFRGNFVLFGIPVSTALYGDAASGAASILIAIVVPLYNGLSVVALEVFKGGRPNPLKILKGVATNPLIIASILGIIVNVCGLKLPGVITKTATDISKLATPMAFIILGASFEFGEVKGYVKELSLTLSMKLVIYPIIFLTAAILVGFRNAPLAVLMTVFGSPIAVSSFTMAQQMGGDDKLAGQLVIFSSILSIFTIFVIIFLLKQLSFF